MSINQTIGRIIYEARIGAHLSQRQLAERMNLARTHVSKVENGGSIPTLQSLEKFAQGLDIKVSQLVRLAEDAPEIPAKKRGKMTPGQKPVTKNRATPKQALLTHPLAVEHRREIGRALGTLPKETR